MSQINTEIFIALGMLCVAFFLVALFLKYRADTSEKRLRSMLERCGLDPELLKMGDTRAIIREVRRRCLKCQTEDVCERWLAGRETGENAFCPNAKTFKILSGSS